MSASWSTIKRIFFALEFCFFDDFAKKKISCCGLLQDYDTLIRESRSPRFNFLQIQNLTECKKKEAKTRTQDVRCSIIIIQGIASTFFKFLL